MDSKIVLDIVQNYLGEFDPIACVEDFELMICIAIPQ
jgi:hypothetical protein